MTSHEWHRTCAIANLRSSNRFADPRSKAYSLSQDNGIDCKQYESYTERNLFQGSGAGRIYVIGNRANPCSDQKDTWAKKAYPTISTEEFPDIIGGTALAVTAYIQHCKKQQKKPKVFFYDVGERKPP